MSIRYICLNCLCFLIVFVLPLHAFAQEDSMVENVHIVINNEEAVFKDPVYIENGRLFVPVSHLVEKLGGTIEWDSVHRKVVITTSFGDQLEFTISKPEMKFNDKQYLMDVEPFIIDSRTYIPLRHAAEFLHADVDWNVQTYTASISIVPLYTFADGDSLNDISKQFETTERLLRERNELVSSEPKTGDILKIIIPDIMKHQVEPQEPEPVYNPEDDPDFMLLAKIIQVEAGYESYEGQLAVGSVIMNRVNDERFPNSIREVIYHPGQFPPAHNGMLDKTEPNDSVLRAAKAVMNGENNVEGALYFYNPKVTSGSFWKSLTIVKEIGSHRFVK